MARRAPILLFFAGGFALSAACSETVELTRGTGAGGCPLFEGATGGTIVPSHGGGGNDGGGGHDAAGGAGGVPNTIGPDEVAARIHGCSKIPYAALGELLRRRGVDLDDTAAGSAGERYASARDAYGAQRRDSLRPETALPTVPSLAWLYDVFLAAAPEIIANIGDPALAPACVAGGSTFPMFDADGKCTFEAVSCLIGQPANAEHLKLCDDLVAEADPGDVADIRRKQILVVGTLLYAAHGCE